MSLELIYTSAPKGLKPGSRGFCTVAMTQGMPPQLVDRLEALSGYRQVFAPQDPQAGLNPVVWSHLRISVAGRNYHVLSRVCAAGLDYSQRTNKFAHHVVLDANELPAAGPAWLLAVPGFMATAWDQTTRLLGPRGRPPAGNSTPAVCQRWQQTTGDAGWGGVLIDAAIKNPKGLVTLIFKPGQDPLPLLAESLALLPVELRWQATFSTYYTKLPPGVECRWRCVVEGSPEAKVAAGVVINLCHRLGQPPAGDYAAAARTGRVPIAKGSPRLISADSPDDSELAQLLGDPNAPPASALVLASAATDWPGSLQPLPPSLPEDFSADPDSTLRPRRRFRQKEGAQWPYIVGMLAVAILMIVGGFAFLNALSGSPAPGPKAAAGPAKPAEVPTAKPVRAAVSPDGKKVVHGLGAAARALGSQIHSAMEHVWTVCPRLLSDEANAGRKAWTTELAAMQGVAQERARKAAVRDLSRLKETLPLPSPRISAPHGGIEIGTLRIPREMQCKLELFGGETLSNGFHLLSVASYDNDASPRLKVSLSGRTTRIPVADFWLANDKLHFAWEDGAGNSPIVGQLLNSVLKISAAGEKPRTFSLRMPAVGSPPINFGKALSSDSGVESGCPALQSPPEPVPDLGVEFIGALEKFKPTQESVGGSRFEVGKRIHFDVRARLGNDGTVTLRMKYLGVLAAWELPKDDALRYLLRTPPDLSRIQPDNLNGIVRHFTQRSAELQKDIKTTRDSPNAKNDDELKKLIEKLSVATQERLSEMNDNERAKTLPEKLTKLTNDCNKYLRDAKSVQSLFAELQETTYGYGVYFTVQCGEEKHKVYLAIADAEPDPPVAVRP